MAQVWRLRAQPWSTLFAIAPGWQSLALQICAASLYMEAVLGAALGATRTDDHELSRTNLNGGATADQPGERVRTALKIVCGPTDQKAML
ncbi:hypothetical protein GCM10010176_024240 [Nonomuraea spiralis]|nr:hypothetical protein GCM10010176_024240 [Nonomuraea spiralis]